MDLGSRSPQFSGSFELQPAPDQNDERHDQQPDILEAGQGCQLIASLATSPRTPKKACSLRQISSMSRSHDEDNPPTEGSSEFAGLPADLRAKAEMIGDRVTLEDAWQFFNYKRTLRSFSTNCSDAGPNSVLDVPVSSSSDQRLKELKNGIVRAEDKEKSIEIMKIVTSVSKRVYLAELIGKYIEETAARKAEPKKKLMKNLRPLSVKNRFTDLLFSETIKCKGEQSSKKEKGKEKGPLEKAKGKFEYWISLGEPLVKMVQRFGIGILLRLPKSLTDKE